MSIGIRIFAWVVHVRLLLLTRGSVLWMILMTERERLRLRGTAWNMVVGGRRRGRANKKEKKRKEASKKGSNRPATISSRRNEANSMAVPAGPRLYLTIYPTEMSNPTPCRHLAVYEAVVKHAAAYLGGRPVARSSRFNGRVGYESRG
jgi:hypothetical protein